MLAAIDVRLYPEEECELPHPCAHLLHAVLLDMVREHDPSMFDQLHVGSRVKPFSLSTLWFRKGTNGGDCLLIPPNTECCFRLSTANRETFEAFSRPLFEVAAANGVIRLGNHSFKIREARMDGKFGGVATYADLMKDAEKTFPLRFVSPTVFRRKGVGVPLPEPELVYGSLWQKWKAFSDVKVDEKVYKEMLSALALSAMDCRTKTWKYPRHVIKGFVGIAEFELVKRVSDDARTLFGALSSLAFFTGVGYKTSMGMGQCRMVEQDDMQTDDAADNS